MMKIYTILLFLFLGCSQEEKQAESRQTAPHLDAKSIYGTWQLEAKYDFPSGFREVEDYRKDTWYFSRDGNFRLESNYTLLFLTIKGTFSVEEDTLALAFYSDIFQKNIIEKYRFSLENNRLFLNAFVSSCIEGCTERYVKLTDE